MNNPIHLSWLGSVEYTKALKTQEQHVQNILDGGNEIILGLEHPSVITLGKRGGSVTRKNIPIIQTNRGGLATGHEPGQVVIYPIINLKKRNIGIRTWVSILEESIISYLEENRLTPTTGVHSGIWVSEKKIASIGLNIVQGVSMHGISLNVHNSLTIFSDMQVCGIPDLSMTSMKHENIHADPQNVFLRISDFIKEWL